MWLPGAMERVAAKALEEGIEVPYAQDLVRGMPCFGRGIGIGKLALAPQGFHARAVRSDQGGPAGSFSRKVQQKPLSLLKALIALGGKEVPRSS